MEKIEEFFYWDPQQINRMKKKRIKFVYAIHRCTDGWLNEPCYQCETEETVVKIAFVVRLQLKWQRRLRVLGASESIRCVCVSVQASIEGPCVACANAPCTCHKIFYAFLCVCYHKKKILYTYQQTSDRTHTKTIWIGCVVEKAGEMNEKKNAKHHFFTIRFLEHGTKEKW